MVDDSDGARRPAQEPAPVERFRRGGSRIAGVVRIVANMILGAGLAVTLVLKVYMLVLTDHACTADGTSLGNLIRCTDSLDLLSAVLALVAGVELALVIFASRFEEILTPIFLAVLSALLALLAIVSGDGAGWQLALLLTAIVLTLSAVVGLTLARSRFGDVRRAEENARR